MQDWTHSDESAGAVGVRLGKAGRGPRPRLFRKGACQADGCGTDLKELPYYYQRNHICTKHNKIGEFECQVRPGAAGCLARRAGLRPQTQEDARNRGLAEVCQDALVLAGALTCSH